MLEQYLKILEVIKNVKKRLGQSVKMTDILVNLHSGNFLAFLHPFSRFGQFTDFFHSGDKTKTRIFKKISDIFPYNMAIMLLPEECL